MPASEQHRKQIMKVVRKREAKTLPEIAAEINVSVKALPVSIGALVRSGQVDVLPGRPARYKKA